MKTVLVLLLIAMMIGVVVSLIRGIVAFLQSTKLDLENPDEADKAQQMQLKQNRMMMNRIKFQFVAIVIVALLLIMAH